MGAFDAFPSFRPLFEPAGANPGPAYLILLNLGADAVEAIRRVRAAVAQSANVEAELVALLADDNWRPHLPAAVAVGLGRAAPAVLAALWQAFDRGSWVAPQLAAAAFLADPDFEGQARARIEGLCPLDTTHLAAMDPLLRHHAAGPAGPVARSAKGLASLLALARLRDSWREWADPLAAREDVRQVLARDFDHGGDIATGWLQRFQELS